MNVAVISVGSNIDPRRNIQKARALLEKDQRFLRASAFVATRPIGGSRQPDFLNGAFLVSTGLELEDFAKSLKDIEKALGRRKSAEKYGPRTIDLDVVVWNGKVVHADFYEREFVRKAVLELLPGFESKAR